MTKNMWNLQIFRPNFAWNIKLRSPSITNKRIIKMTSHINETAKPNSMNDMFSLNFSLIFLFAFVFIFCLHFVQVDTIHEADWWKIADIWWIDLSSGKHNFSPILKLYVFKNCSKTFKNVNSYFKIFAWWYIKYNFNIDL